MAKIKWEAFNSYGGASHEYAVDIPDEELDNLETNEEKTALIRERVLFDFLREISFRITGIER